MYRQLEKTKEYRNRTVASSVSQNKSNVKKAFGFMVNRPEAVTQWKLDKTENKGFTVIQRLGPDIGASSPGLVAEYNNLLLSETFQELNQIATTNRDITLIDSSLIPGQPTDYAGGPHRIRVPINDPLGAPRPLADVRDDIMWEMHNATTRGATNRTGAKLLGPAPGPGASSEERKLHAYKIAAGALSHEWEEWILVAEHDLRVQHINADPAMVGLGGGPHVTRAFGGAYAVPDGGWYLFENYLAGQLAGGHTAAYDPNAGAPNWKGNRILNIVRSKSLSYLKITQKQIRDWNSGRRKKIKSINNNPFNKMSIIEEARRGE